MRRGAGRPDQVNDRRHVRRKGLPRPPVRRGAPRLRLAEIGQVAQLPAAPARQNPDRVPPDVRSGGDHEVAERLLRVLETPLTRRNA
jgi:hypothetical protein